MIPKPAAVHQFHPGTAEGDAVTQQMLDLQRRLQRLGYRSEVYALEIPPALLSTIHHLDEYVAAPEQVLLLHHSIGNPALERVAALPEPKVLCYHNITPEAYFDSDVMREAIRLGRAQLQTLPRLTGAAIANSNFSRRELLAAGFDTVEVMPVRTTFDVFRDGPVADRSRDWLAVGRVVGNKCQHEIVQAFGVYATAFDPEAHLHLIGDPSDRFYVAELHDLAKQMGVDSRLHVWGKTSQEELVHRYRTSGLYVSLSEHEGFGVPLLEAMAAGLPVVAFASTAVPETMGGAGIQVHDKDPWFVATLAKTIADDDGLRERIVARQAERVAQLAAFDVDAVVERAIRLTLGEKQPLRVQVQGPFETSYSLATLNRELRAGARPRRRRRRLDLRDGGPRRLHAPTTGPAGPPGRGASVRRGGGDPLSRRDDPPALPPSRRGRSRRRPLPLLRLGRVPHPPGVRGVVQRAPRRDRDDVDLRARPASRLGRDGADRRDRRWCRGTAPSTPPRCRTTSATTRASSSSTSAQACPARPSTSSSPRTSPPSPATTTSPSCSRPTPTRTTRCCRSSARARGSHPNPPDVCWIDEDLPRAQVESLYGIARCYVHPARGEGFGLPVAEAMLAEVPVITVAHGGLADFCSDETALIVPHRIEAARTHLTVPGSTWAEPDRTVLARLMRAVYDRSDPEAIAGRVARGKAVIEDQFSWDAVGARWSDLIDVLRAEARTLDLAMVTPWNSPVRDSRVLPPAGHRLRRSGPSRRPGRPERAAGGPGRGARDHPRLGRPLAPGPGRPDRGDRRLPGRAGPPAVQLRLLRARGAGRVHRRGRERAGRRHHVPHDGRHAHRRRARQPRVDRRRARPRRPPHRPPAGRRGASGQLRTRRQRAARTARSSRTGAREP